MNQRRDRKERSVGAVKTALKYAFSLHEDTAHNDEIRDRLLSGGKVTGTNLCVMICAVIIASAGLNVNSTAVIIGAMLISPLMGSLLAIAYGTASADPFTTERHLIGFLFQVLASIAAATVYFLLSPVKEATPELLARTSPTFFDVVIAVTGGVAGIIGQTRKDKANNIIPGVAIATALMPPLATCGYSIANRNWTMLGGALYLFVINSYFIYFSADVILTVLSIPKVREFTPEEWRKKQRRMLRNAVLIAIPAIVFTFMISNT
ncbi:MAG: DUF389 domain-containing protein [Oscillospiraceae bacterium]|nr:DUF389 domain-containing protein [Oscillospiraceae bacterium]